MPETEASTRTAGTLSGANLGTTITVSTASWVITGVLHEVDHKRDWVGAGVFHRGDPSCLAGRRHVELTIGPWSGEVPPDAAVSIAGMT